MVVLLIVTITSVVINPCFPNYDCIVILFLVAVVQTHPAQGLLKGQKMTVFGNRLLIFNLQFIVSSETTKNERDSQTREYNKCT